MGNGELVGKRFSEWRQKCGLTQKVAAEYLGVDQSYVSKCQKGFCERPGLN
ncbi:MAG TPA: helix-turn-helix transcriptional regulator [Clostridia bacterium]|nr:helix-turn-helix transcriptional regulator [Clostridia bacterium]